MRAITKRRTQEQQRRGKNNVHRAQTQPSKRVVRDKRIVVIYHMIIIVSSTIDNLVMAYRLLALEVFPDVQGTHRMHRGLGSISGRYPCQWST